jgi:hypothetical protein
MRHIQPTEVSMLANITVALLTIIAFGSIIVYEIAGKVSDPEDKDQSSAGRQK